MAGGSSIDRSSARWAPSGTADEDPMTASITPLRTETGRMAIDHIDESTRHDSATVTVILHWDGCQSRWKRDEVTCGHASTSPGGPRHPKSLASSGAREFSSIEASTSTTVGVHVAARDPLTSDPLIGTTVMPDDNPQLGFARAVLDAVNRRVEAN